MMQIAWGRFSAAPWYCQGRGVFMPNGERFLPLPDVGDILEQAEREEGLAECVNASWSLMREKGGLAGTEYRSELWFLSWLASLNTSLWKQSSPWVVFTHLGPKRPKAPGIHYSNIFTPFACFWRTRGGVCKWEKLFHAEPKSTDDLMCRGGPVLGRQKESAV